MGRFQQAKSEEKVFQRAEASKKRTKVEKVRVGGALITEGLECCAQEFGPHSVNSGEPVRFYAVIRSNSGDYRVLTVTQASY